MKNQIQTEEKPDPIAIIRYPIFYENDPDPEKPNQVQVLKTKQPDPLKNQ